MGLIPPPSLFAPFLPSPISLPSVSILLCPLSPTSSLSPLSSPIVLSRLKTISAENRNRQENPTQAKGAKKKKRTKKGGKKEDRGGRQKQNQTSRFQTAQNSQNQTADKTIKQQKQNLEMRKSKKRSKRGRHLRTHLDNPPPLNATLERQEL